jgi:L-ascorbate metabolism protein UlaG (beta-lactamase superfamily)
MFGPKLPVDTPPGMIAGPAMAMWIIVVWGYYIDWSSTDENSDRRHRSIHFKKGIFRNEAQIESKSLLEYVKARHSNVWAKWPSWLEADYGPIPSDRVDGDELLVTLVNHSTVLIQGYGYNVITDPIFSKRCSPVQFAGPKRVRNPGIRFSDLPKIDLVLVSHDHYDHLDLDTIHKLAERDHCKVLVGLGVGERLSEKVDYAELDWWEDLKISQNLKATFVPVQHFSGRSLFDRDTTLWGGFVLELGEKKIYFGGDTGYADHFKNTSERFGSMDLSLIPIGAYAPRSFMAPMHINPKEAVTAHFDLRSKKSIGIHYGTFQLTAEGPYEPTQLLKLEAAKAGVNPEDFVILEFGHPMKLKS